VFFTFKPGSLTLKENAQAYQPLRMAAVWHEAEAHTVSHHKHPPGPIHTHPMRASRIDSRTLQGGAGAANQRFASW
jgi:hypothetical protein